MALITFSGGINDATRVQRWEDQSWHVHQRDQFFGTGPGGLAKMDDPNAVVNMKSDFSKKGGYQMTETLMDQFTGEGVINDEVLEDQEEAPDFHALTWTISQLRNAGRTAGKETEQQINQNLPAEIRRGLGEWMPEKRDEHIFDAIALNPTKIFYVNDRAGTGTVVATDLMTLNDWVRAQTYAKSSADPKLPPIKISKINQKTVYRYVVVMHDHVSYDLKVNDPTYQQAARESQVRGAQNQLITGALLDWQGMALFDHDNCTIFAGWGTGADVSGAESYLMGRQAVIVGLGGYRYENRKSFVRIVEKRFDYQNQYGYAIGIIKGEAKATFNSKDFSIVAYRSARTAV